MVNEWTRDDLPTISAIAPIAADPKSYAYFAVSIALDAVVAHLNEHHPKPDDSFSDRVWKRAYESMRRERDAAVARAEQAENARDTAATRAEQMEKALAASRDAHQRSADAHMEWKARAEQAESELKPSSPLRQQADSWMRIVNHPAISQSLSEKNKSYSDQVFERITWLFEAAEDARESNPAPAVTRDDIGNALMRVGVSNGVETHTEVSVGTDAVWALVSGADPAVYVIRESDLPTVQQDEDGEWYPGDRWDLADDRFIDVEGALEKMHLYAAIARAIEAEQAADPVEALADDFAQALAGDENIGGSWSMDPAAWRDIARALARRAHDVLGQEVER